ncbi:MAG: hypothetical protein RDU20_11435 [Desulfomonilaceae bacterium]|nr:hypothetical protein [Desulfomonilaceae bacterium]
MDTGDRRKKHIPRVGGNIGVSGLSDLFTHSVPTGSREGEIVWEKQIEALIDAGWRVVAGDVGDCALEQWRRSARECLCVIAGPDHTYTEHFSTERVQSEPPSVLADVGVLVAARLSLAQVRRDDESNRSKIRETTSDSMPRRAASAPGR